MDQQDGSEHFYHHNTVNAVDMIPASKGTAEQHPILTMGVWDSASELLSGLQIAKITGRGLVNTPQTMSGGSALCFKGALLRKAVEEWKVSAGVTDQVVSPHEHPNFPFNVFTTDDRRLNYKTLTRALLRKEEFISFSWAVNHWRHIPSTRTGKRTSFVYLLSEAGETTDPQSLEGIPYGWNNLLQSAGLGKFEQMENTTDDSAEAERRFLKLNAYNHQYFYYKTS